MENNKYKTIDEALTDLGWFHIDNIQTSTDEAIKHIQSIFNPFELDEDGQPKIVTDKTTIIICDNHDFNETYLIDLVSSELKKKDYKPGTYELILIDNVSARCYIQDPKFIQYLKEEEYKTIEKNKLKPCVIVVNPTNNTMVMFEEKLTSIIDETIVNYLLQYADDETCKNLITTN